MSEVKRYGHIGYLAHATEPLQELYRDMKVYVLEADYDAKCHAAEVYFGSWKRTEEERDAAQVELAALREELARKDIVIEEMLESNSDMTTCLAAAEQRNADLIELLKRIDRTPLDRWYRDALNVAVAAAINPTESGVSE